MTINVPNLKEVVEEEKKEVVEEEKKGDVEELEKEDESKADSKEEAKDGKVKEGQKEQNWQEMLTWEEFVQSKGSQNCFNDESVQDKYADICGILSQAGFRYIWSVL